MFYLRSFTGCTQLTSKYFGLKVKLTFLYKNVLSSKMVHSTFICKECRFYVKKPGKLTFEVNNPKTTVYQIHSKCKIWIFDGDWLQK